MSLHPITISSVWLLSWCGARCSWSAGRLWARRECQLLQFVQRSFLFSSVDNQHPGVCDGLRLGPHQRYPPRIGTSSVPWLRADVPRTRLLNADFCFSYVHEAHSRLWTKVWMASDHFGSVLENVWNDIRSRDPALWGPALEIALAPTILDNTPVISLRGTAAAW
ncbi:hypothetical protein LXA43DRAFT_10410 [Ganoderma leucocontextum]|nr:hypothetical protein LXA43DRAFT_10410 [Ganoderma leucocontextum]